MNRTLQASTSRPKLAAPNQSLGRILGPRLGLPLMMLGIAALVPARIMGLAELWSGATPSASAIPSIVEAPALEVVGSSMTLRSGVTVTPTVSTTLSGAVRTNPLAETRQNDGRLLAEVSRRQAETERRERSLEVREARAVAAETMARTQLAELAKLREEVERLVAREMTAAEGDIDSLVSLYVNMRPQQAAKVLERLEATQAAVILLKIPERQAGPILAQMDPPAAMAVTQEIAGRREAFRRQEK